MMGNLQETPILHGNNHGFRLRFSLKALNQSIDNGESRNTTKTKHPTTASISVIQRPNIQQPDIQASQPTAAPRVISWFITHLPSHCSTVVTLIILMSTLVIHHDTP